ncbi:MAG: cytochrome b/b6 domain-containing protein [Rhodoplanes sp.]
MQWRNSPDRYGAVVQGSHWLTVLLIVFAWLLGQYMDGLPRAVSPTAHWLHNEAGLLVLIFLAVRLAWRWIDVKPAPEKSRFGVFAVRAAQFAHIALYALMLAVTVTGITLVFVRGRALDVLGLVQIASPWARDPAFARSVVEIHGLLSNILMLLAFAHALAALAHHWVLRDSTLRRMLPGRAL